MLDTDAYAAIECLLFVSGEPLPLAELASLLGMSEPATETALRGFQSRLVDCGSALQLLEIAGGWQLATRPELAELVGRFRARGATRLSRAALETLAVIAYRQPTTAPELEAVRGVQVGSVLETLLERRLIAEVGRKATPGRPVLYATTAEFLHYFGLNRLADLPVLEVETSMAVSQRPDEARV